MAVVNKFNIRWQIARVEARNMLTTNEKIIHVLLYLKEYPNIHNWHRVLNWVRTSAMSSCSSLSRREFEEFEDFEAWLKRHCNEFLSKEDNSDNLLRISTEDLEMVLKDLNKRKYAFQFEGHVPKAHVEFVTRVQEELERRNKGGHL